jgi:hypothetical protein
MASYLWIRFPNGQEVRELSADLVSVGAADTNDVAIAADPLVSRLHAAFERLAGGWCVRDLGSRNGTFLNGARLVDERPLRTGDEIRVGQTTLVFRTDEALGPQTQGALAPPKVTDREREVLMELCRPLTSGDIFTEPATVREIAGSLGVTEGAIKQHLATLYDKFALADTEEHRRARLANEALHRGVITLADLRGHQRA